MTVDHQRLFEVPEPGIDTPGPKPSRDARRTARARLMIANGKHPATGRCLLRIEDPTQARVCCGDCDHAVVNIRNRVYWKCEAHPGGVTRGPATDIRISWPACVLFVRAQPAPAKGIRRGRYPAVKT